jgi:predicted nucleotidyltransferase
MLYGARLHGIVLYGSCARGTGAPESEHLLSVVPVDVALYNRGEYTLYRQAKAEDVAL